ncbi:unnamed protein product [Caenorhabditis sp. 36 PRJEB53466]|nr:unnamed protein product [Caenorhabditis sp. 36 PRJEB53466]
MSLPPSAADRAYQDFNGSYVDDVNSYVTGVISLLSNCLLIYATSQVKSYTNSVRWSQYLVSLLRIVFSISIALSCPSMEYAEETESLYIVKNGIDIPLVAGETCLAVFIVAIVMSCNGPAVQYLQVTLLLSASTKSQSNRIVSLIPLMVGVPTVILVYFGYIPFYFNVAIAKMMMEKMGTQGTAAFLIVTVHLKPIESNNCTFELMSLICTLFILIVMFSSLLVIIVCYLSIQRKMKYRNGLKTGSKSTQSTQEQLNKVLLIQFVFPFVTIHMPFYLTFILPFFNDPIRFFTDNILYLCSWCPALDPVLVIIIVKNIREVVLPRNIVQFRVSDKSSEKCRNSRVFAIRA